MIKPIKQILCLLAVTSLSGCTMLGTYMSPQNPAPEYQINGHAVRTRYVRLSPTWIEKHNRLPAYHIGPYDVLNVIVWDHPELTTPSTQVSTPSDSGILVDNRGYITFPFGGTFKVSGLLIPQIEKLIAKRISKYIRNPQVTVRVAAFRSEEAQVLGEVGVTKTVPLTDKPITLLDALNYAGGTNPLTANTAEIYVVRGNMDQLTVYALNAKTPQTMMVAQKFYLKNNDIIYVPPVPIANWNRVISQIIPSFAGVATAQAIDAAALSK